MITFKGFSGLQQKKVGSLFLYKLEDDHKYTEAPLNGIRVLVGIWIFYLESYSTAKRWAKPVDWSLWISAKSKFF